MNNKIVGVNLGNWLVLEKWMEPTLFEGTEANDEVWLNRKLGKEVMEPKMKLHRNSYVTEKDFERISSWGMNMVRIPIPYFIFGDREPFVGCAEELDRAFDWAEEYQIKILIDLHTVPGSQNGYDNGGICGVCKWRKDRKEVEYVLTVLERLSERYGKRRGLFGIEVLNEPISLPVWLTSPNRKMYKDKEEAKGSGYVPMSFLKPFYTEAYERMRKYLPEEKAIVFQDGFRLTRWKRFFKNNNMKNVYLDTHIYIFAMESFVPIHKPWIYQMYVKFNQWKIKRVNQQIPVIVGEWCICNKYAMKMKRRVMRQEDAEREKKQKFQQIARLQLEAWSTGAGFFYWNYQLVHDENSPMDEEWKDSWDLRRCYNNEWMPPLNCGEGKNA